MKDKIAAETVDLDLMKGNFPFSLSLSLSLSLSFLLTPSPRCPELASESQATQVRTCFYWLAVATSDSHE
jgi:hypothetical protein